MREKKLVYEVNVIRPLVILLLVVFHCFCVHAKNWDPIPGVFDIPAYYWIANFISGFQLETMAVVCGYIYAFQAIDLKKEYSLGNFMRKKGQRLLVPCLFWGVIYFFVILQPLQEYSFGQALFIISNGSGHLWFLPMIFWCFVFLWLIHRHSPSRLLAFVVLSALSVLPVPALPFGLTRMPHFAFYAYAGYCLWIYREQLHGFFLKKRWVLLFAASYMSLLYWDCSLEHFGEEGYTMPLYAKILTRVLKYFIVFTGVLSLYLSVCLFTVKRGITPPRWVIQSSKICFGVYIFHQFILKYLYYLTPMPEIVGSAALPWVGLAIALPLSILLSLLFVQTKVGRSLIG